MKKARFGPPSPAMVVAVIALVVAMVGTGYAAIKLPKNSVGTKQVKKNAITTAKIKKNAVTGAKVKDASLTGADINVSTLGTVPSANTANSLAAAEPIHLIGAAGEPGFQGGSGNVSAPGLNVQPAGFYKDRAGFVHLEGIVQAGKEILVLGVAPIFTLPAGYRPGPGITQIFGGGENAAVVFGSSTTLEGKVVDGVVGGSAEQLTVLSGITYRPGS